MVNLFKSIILPVTGFFILSLSACQSTTNQNLKTTYDKAPYKRIIQISSNHIGLKNSLIKLASKQSNLLVKNNDNFSEFKLNLEVQIKRINSLEKKPLLLGRLQKTIIPINFKVNYTLSNNSKHVISKGEVSELADSSTTIYPKLNLSNKIKESILLKLSQKIITEITNPIKTTSWSTTVIGQKDYMHISIASGLDSDLKVGDKFISKTKPTAKLELVTFEKTATGNSRAILRLVDGFLPNAGRKLIAVK